MSDLEGVVPALAEALEKRGYNELTPVQKSMLDPNLVESDALVSAQTGSGKTVAFGLALAPTLLQGADKFPRCDAPLALIVAPTRELALQVKREFEWLYASTGAIIASCVGGMDMRTERRALERGAHIVVGTPGRLRDHIMRKSLNTTQLKAAVLDEADEMLDLGFKEDLEFILEATPEERRTLLFSATVPPMIGKLAKQYQRDAVRVQTSEELKQHGDIEYRALVTAPRERENAIINVLRYYEAENALVFCNTRATVNHMVSRFNNRGFSVVALSGELSQNERTHALQSMRDGRARVCIATDVAARGIDLPKLELVIHADLPSNAETLLHRSGRTGRAGRKGVSALMVDVKGRKKAERLLGWAKINAEWGTPPSADDVNRRDEERMLSNPILTDPIDEDEQAFISRLMADHSPEQIAAAFLRQNKAGQSAPEEIRTLDVHAPAKREFKDRNDNRRDRGERGERDSPRERRDEFDESVWISLSVGRKQNAEPRWLIPLICNGGDITKRDIGMIKMQNDETYVQLNAEEADGFFDTLGSNQALEKNVRVTRLEGKPSFDVKPHRKGGSDKHEKRDRKYGDRPKRKDDDAKRDFKKPYADKKPAGKPRPDKKPRWDAEKREAAAAAKAKGDKPEGKKFEGKKSAGDKKGWAKKKPGGPKKVRNGPAGKSGGKPPFAKKGPKKKKLGAQD